MKTAKRRVILCICAVLLLSGLLGFCNLEKNQETTELNDTNVTQSSDAETGVETTEDLDSSYARYKDFGDEPYRITLQSNESGNGVVAIVDFNPYYTKPFVLEIPEADEYGNLVTSLVIDSTAAVLPTMMSEADFEVFRDKLSEYYGLEYEEAIRIVEKNEFNNSKYADAFYLRKHTSYFSYKNLALVENAEIREHMLSMYPLLETMNLYVLEPTTLTKEIGTLCIVARKAAPELVDTWYYEACGRTEQPYASGLGETMTEIRWASGLTEIAPLTFAGCNSLKNITVPGTVKTVGLGAFACCDALEEITFAEGVKVLEENVLSDCTQLKAVNLPASLESIEYLFGLPGGLNEDEPELPIINYAGTIEQWKALAAIKESDGDIRSRFENVTVHCSDGTMEATDINE